MSEILNSPGIFCTSKILGFYYLILQFCYKIYILHLKILKSRKKYFCAYCKRGRITDACPQTLC